MVIECSAHLHTPFKKSHYELKSMVVAALLIYASLNYIYLFSNIGVSGGSDTASKSHKDGPALVGLTVTFLIILEYYFPAFILAVSLLLPAGPVLSPAE
jgi:hypothetical protein